MGKGYEGFVLVSLSVGVGLHSRRAPRGDSTQAEMLAALQSLITSVGLNQAPLSVWTLSL